MKEESERVGLKIRIRKEKKKNQLMSLHPAPLFMVNRRGEGGSSDRFPLLRL